MVDDSGPKPVPGLPPKLNLRKKGVVKDTPEEPAAKVEPAAKKETPKLEIKPAAPSPAVEKPAPPSSQPAVAQPKPPTPAAPAAPKPAAPAVGAKPPAAPQVVPAAPSPGVGKPLQIRQPPTAPQAAAKQPEPTAPAAAKAKPPASAEATPKVSPDQAPKPETPKPQSAPASPATAPAAPAAAAPKAPIPLQGQKSKKETARIPLEAAISGPGTGKQAPTRPKTVRIKPAAEDAATIRATQPISGIQIPTAMGGTKPSDKRKTSRISLETAFGSKEEGEETGDGAPKTIRLKRPGEAATVKAVKPPETDSAKEQAAASSKAAFSKTAPIEDIAQEESESSPTRRKTIRVKRPTQAATVPSMSVARPEQAEKPAAAAAASGAPATAASATSAAPVDEPGLVFSLIAMAATGVTCALLYFLAAQTFPGLSQ